MTRHLRALLALALLPLLLAAPSSAAERRCNGYVPCENPRVQIASPGVVKRSTRPTLSIRVVPTRSGNTAVTGKLVVSLKRVGGGFGWKRTFSYTGVTKKVRPPRLTKRGRYTVTVRFTPPPRSVYGPSAGRRSFRVR
jgi:hypothetical protein